MVVGGPTDCPHRLRDLREIAGASDLPVKSGSWRFLIDRNRAARFPKSRKRAACDSWKSGSARRDQEIQEVPVRSRFLMGLPGRFVMISWTSGGAPGVSGFPGSFEFLIPRKRAARDMDSATLVCKVPLIKNFRGYLTHPIIIQKH